MLLEFVLKLVGAGSLGSGKGLPCAMVIAPSPSRLLLNKPCSFVFPQFYKMASNEAEFYTFDALDIDGNNVSMGKYSHPRFAFQGECGHCRLTKKNYAQLQDLYTKYSSQGLRILAFPCNQFRNQEPGTNAEIKEAARNKFGLTFDFFSKVDVNGPDALPLFIYLQKTLKGTLTNIKWNFTKFLIDRNGIPYKRYSPTTDPEMSTKAVSPPRNLHSPKTSGDVCASVSPMTKLMESLLATLTFDVLCKLVYFVEMTPPTFPLTYFSFLLLLED
ncbi:Glutathione peroxidase [Echinococcus granulosus]|uniref:Glutathione peroxidase n=1 Tax=Echinococcus granulosus TaxID=6210 RepID=W6UCC3_ECHGR|nr:Glutathione peroxidase [Echinococcus granulosus]EUB58341.1 Glutathione peroxidase [Echinococcus granulosus]